MKNQITTNSEYNTLEKVLEFLKKESDYKCSQEYDSWDVRIAANGQMEKCVIIKKSLMHGMKVYFSSENEMVMTYVIPNKMMNAYFGESKKARKSIFEILAGVIKKAVLNGPQNKAFDEMEEVLIKMAA